MKQSVRACVAYIAARLIMKRDFSHFYDAAQARYLVISGSVGARAINVHDFARDCRMTGAGVRSRFSLYDHGEAGHLSLLIEGDRFEGYDYDTTCHFRGTVDGSNVSLYDYGEGRRYSYRL